MVNHETTQDRDVTGADVENQRILVETDNAAAWRQGNKDEPAWCRNQGSEGSCKDSAKTQNLLYSVAGAPVERSLCGGGEAAEFPLEGSVQAH